MILGIASAAGVLFFCGVWGWVWLYFLFWEAAASGFAGDGVFAATGVVDAGVPFFGGV